MLIMFCITPNPQAKILGVQKLDSHTPLWTERQALHQGTCNSITWLVAGRMPNFQYSTTQPSTKEQKS